MKKIFKILFLFFFILTTIISSCNKKDVPILETSELNDIAVTTATGGGIIGYEGSTSVVSRGVCWSTKPNPTIKDAKTEDGAGGGSFISHISELNGGTVYFVRAYAINGIGTGYGITMSFQTLGEAPTVSTQVATDVKVFNATLNCIFNANYLSTVLSFQFGTSTAYGQTIAAEQSPSSGHDEMPASANISGLNGGTTYHFRVKAVNSLGTSYGKDLTFTTAEQLPSAITLIPDYLTNTSVKLKGTVNPNELSTYVTFEYWTDINLINYVTAAQSPLSGGSDNLVSANIADLNPDKTYSFRVTAENAKGISNGEILIFKTLKNDQIADIEGNAYNAVSIGTQVWMMENLKTTKFNDGTEIPNVTDIFNGVWAGLNTPAYCWYNNEKGYKSDYGALYNWYTIKSGNLCPSGWHIPTHAEWTILVDYCGGVNVAGNKLKGNTATAQWNPAQNYFDMTNETGFTALPGASRYPEGIFWLNMGYMGSWWTSSELDLNNSWMRRMVNKPGIVYVETGNKKYGLSVRCIKD